jgi:two-component system chemotaxis response regulator CheY
MKTCLIVEDSEIIREIAARILAEIPVEAKEAETAAAAIDLCREVKIDAVLLDWDLPTLGALDFLRGAAELPQEQRPVIILCATENDPQQFTLAKAAGAAHYLLKPFDRQSIEAKLAEIGMVEGATVTNAKTAKAS